MSKLEQLASGHARFGQLWFSEGFLDGFVGLLNILAAADYRDFLGCFCVSVLNDLYKRALKGSTGLRV
jgi:hypothetical protein